MGKIIDDKTFHFLEPCGTNQVTGEEEYIEFDLVIPMRKDGLQLVGFVGCNAQYQ